MAHHSLYAVFDEGQTVTLKGLVSKVEWVNPHAWIHVEVKKPDGKIEVWMVEGGTPNTLLRRGLTRDTLKYGTEIIVDGYQTKDHSLKRANGRDVTFPEGTVVTDAAQHDDQEGQRGQHVERHRDGLADEPNPVPSQHRPLERAVHAARRGLGREIQVGVGKDRGDSRHRDGSRDFHPQHPGMGHHGSDERGVNRTLSFHVVGVPAPAAEEPRVFGAEDDAAED